MELAARFGQVVCGRRALAFAGLVALAIDTTAQCPLTWQRFPWGQLPGHWSETPVLLADGRRGVLYAGAGDGLGWHLYEGDGSEWHRVGAVLNGKIRALEFFDEDGVGPNPPVLFVGGPFTQAGAIPAGRITRWDGSGWSAVGPGLDDTVMGFAVFDDDGPGPNRECLYVGGRFRNAGTLSVNRIAKWDGVSWSGLGSGMDGDVQALCVYDEDANGPSPPALIALGRFAAAGGSPALSIARWDGVSWSGIGGGFAAVTGGYDGGGAALAVYDEDGAGPAPPALFAGGDYLAPGPGGSSGIVRWNGSTWSAVGTGAGGWVRAMCVLDDDGPGPRPESLFVGGYFGITGPSPAQYIARWDGVAWSALASGPTTSDVEIHVRSIVPFDEDGSGPQAATLFVSGHLEFPTYEGHGNYGLTIARWDAVAWTWPEAGIRDGVTGFALWDEAGSGGDNPHLYACGSFLLAGGQLMRHVTRWDGTNWAPIGAGIASCCNADVRALIGYDEDGPGPRRERLVAGGLFWNFPPGSPPVESIARWDGVSWNSFVPGFGGGSAVSALATFDADGAGPLPPSLYKVTGGVQRWTGSTWESTGTAVAGAVRALVALDEDGPGPSPGHLYAAWMATWSPTQTSIVSRYDGSSWTKVGRAFQGAVQALVLFDPDGSGPGGPELCAGGSFTAAGSAPARNLARWTGADWREFGGGTDGTVRCFEVFDEDGPGGFAPSLYVGGEFALAGATPARCLARWDGSSWTAVGAFSSAVGTVCVSAMQAVPFGASRPPCLWVGGWFSELDGLPTSSVAKLWGCPPSTVAFCAGDGTAAACPCGNAGIADHGCAHSLAPEGASLVATGWPSVGLGALVLNGERLPDSVCVFLQGTSPMSGGAGVALGDGLRCVAGNLLLFGVSHSAQGVVAYPGPGDPPVFQVGNCAPGDRRYYQIFYRNPDPMFCTPATFNLSNGLDVRWTL